MPSLSQQHTLLHLEQQRQLQLQQRKLRAELVKQQLQQNSHTGDFFFCKIEIEIVKQLGIYSGTEDIFKISFIE